jgi:hypothetical protein
MEKAPSIRPICFPSAYQGIHKREEQYHICRLCSFNAPEEHIMYLHPLSMGPETSSWALVHKTTFAPMIYTALCTMFWMRAYPLLGQVGGCWALEFSSFLGPKWHLPIGLMPFHRAQKTLKFQGPTPSHLPL